MVDYEVARCAKPMVAMKLKSDDELVNVEIDTDNIVLVSENGYYLNFKSEELPIVGAKASGVKGINLKDDILVSLTTYNEKQEYITLFTDNKTAKRIKITDLESHSRAKKGSTILKKTKTVTYKVLNVFATSARDLVLTKADSEINIFKNSDITIMDLASTGSSISKYKLDLARKVTIKESVKEDKEIKQEDVNLAKVSEETKAMSMEDFLDDFKI